MWEARAWQDPNTGEAFDTYDQIGATFPEIADTVYQEQDGSYWLDREWHDPETRDTWHTYENVGVPVDDQLAASLPSVQVHALPMAQAQGSCHPVTSVVVVEGTVGLLPTTSGLTPFDVTPGNAGAVSDVATAGSPLTQPGLQAFDQATSNLRDVNAARTAGQLASQVADEFANAIVPPPPGTPGSPGGLGGPGGPGSPGAGGGLLGGGS